MSDSRPRVFISYSHDSQQHCAVVFELSNTLHRHGIDVELDRYHVRPEKGWPHWCEEQLRPENSKFVIVVCTDTYRRRVEDKVPTDEGRGVFWEGAIIYQYLYDSKGNDRFIPVLLPGAIENDIPTPLRGTTRYHLAQLDLSDAGYEALYRELTGQPLVSKPPMGQIVTLPSYGAGSPQALAPLPRRSAVTEFTLPVQIGRVRLRHGAERLFGREEDLKHLDAAWDDPKTHVLTIVAWGGVGKTSLVMEWMARKAAAGWPGFERVFEWSFYSQGTREQGAASAEQFIAEALKFFGDPDPMQGSSWDRGERLARLVAERKSLLVLDGLEPLQHPPGSAQPGKLKDPALEMLLKGLARYNPGLCLVTTRETVDDLKTWDTTTAPEWELKHLSPEAGAAVLYQAGVRRAGAAEIKPEDQELKDASEEVKGHALTLQLLGSYLAGAHRGDIRKRTRVKLEEADKALARDELPYGHAFKVMHAYEIWLQGGGRSWFQRLVDIAVPAWIIYKIRHA